VACISGYLSPQSPSLGVCENKPRMPWRRVTLLPPSMCPFLAARHPLLPAQSFFLRLRTLCEAKDDWDDYLLVDLILGTPCFAFCCYLTANSATTPGIVLPRLWVEHPMPPYQACEDLLNPCSEVRRGTNQLLTNQQDEIYRCHTVSLSMLPSLRSAVQKSCLP
jgi:hypothetical protein